MIDAKEIANELHNELVNIEGKDIFELLEEYCKRNDITLSHNQEQNIYKEMDNLGFMCAGCNWYCWIDELSDIEEENVCNECRDKFV